MSKALESLFAACEELEASDVHCGGSCRYPF